MIYKLLLKKTTTTKDNYGNSETFDCYEPLVNISQLFILTATAVCIGLYDDKNLINGFPKEIGFASFEEKHFEAIKNHAATIEKTIQIFNSGLTPPMIMAKLVLIKADLILFIKELDR